MPDYVVTLESAWIVKDARSFDDALGIAISEAVEVAATSGVNLASVKKLSIGVGNRASPKAGGTGMVYLDDILVGHPAAAGLAK
jgi:uncharacterized protein (UPF0212 family)